MSRRRLGGFVLVALLFAMATPASAHVSVNPNKAAKGSRTKVAFRVPNERPDAQTVRFEVSIPADPPIQTVRTRPVPGWRATVEKSKLAQPLRVDDREITEVVTRIVWEGGSLKEGEFEDFEVSLGPLPTTTDKIVFKAIQTLSNGEQSRFDEVATPENKDPEHPAPVLSLTPEEAGGHGHLPAAQTVASDSKSDDVGIASLLAGALAVVALLVSMVAVRVAKSNR